MCLLSPLIPTAMVLSSRWRHLRRTRQALPLSTPLARSDKSYRDRRTWHAATLSSLPGLFSSRVLLFRSRRHEDCALLANLQGTSLLIYDNMSIKKERRAVICTGEEEMLIRNILETAQKQQKITNCKQGACVS